MSLRPLVVTGLPSETWTGRWSWIWLFRVQLNLCGRGSPCGRKCGDVVEPADGVFDEVGITADFTEVGDVWRGRTAWCGEELDAVNGGLDSRLDTDRL